MYKILFVFIFIASFGQSLSAQLNNANLVKQIMETIGYNYYDTTYGAVDNWDAFKSNSIQAALNGGNVDSLVENIFIKIDDPTLRILKPDEFSIFFDEIMGRKHTGIGLSEMMSLEIRKDKNGEKSLEVVTPIYDTPAFEAEIVTGTRIKSINGQSVDGLALEDVMKLIRVKEGKSVELNISNAAQPQSIILQSKELTPITRPLYKIIKYKRKKIGIIWIPQFTENISFHFLSVLKKLKDENVDGLVLDVRHNPGGIITEAQSMAGFFIGLKPMAYTQSKNSAIKMMATNTQKMFDQPLTILVNEGTASAAEAFTGVLQYYKRATVIGTKTNGKGLIYGFYEVDNQSTIVIPIGRLKMLDQKDIDTEGITPDEEFSSSKRFHLNSSYKKDPMLKYGVEQLFKTLKE